MMCNYINIGIKAECTVLCHLGLRLPDMLLVEQELAVEIAHIYCVQINLKEKKKRQILMYWLPSVQFYPVLVCRRCQKAVLMGY